MNPHVHEPVVFFHLGPVFLGFGKVLKGSSLIQKSNSFQKGLPLF